MNDPARGLKTFLAISFIAVVTLFSNMEDVKKIRQEEQCSGELSIAPGEDYKEIRGTLLYQINHRGISVGPDTVGFSVLDTQDQNKIVFSGKVQVSADSSQSISGLDFRGRGSSDQNNTGDLFTLTEVDSCLEISF